MKHGIAAGFGCYFLWGVLAIYWKTIVGAGAYEILANRVVWSFVFMLLVFALLGQNDLLRRECRGVIRDKRKLWTVVKAGVLVTLNWGIYIWAVADGRILETSMGYYINPLVSVLFGVVFLRERLDNWTRVSVALAFIGVCIMVYRVGVFPWVALGVSLTFASYGLIKKQLQLDTKVGILLETAVVLPLALAYLGWLSVHNAAAWQHAPTFSLVLLVGAGVVTAVPLLLFTAAAKKLTLTILGFLQYLTPTMTLLIGTLLYGEPFTMNHLYSFGWIWAGLAVFTVNQLRSH